MRRAPALAHVVALAVGVVTACVAAGCVDAAALGAQGDLPTSRGDGDGDGDGDGARRARDLVVDARTIDAIAPDHVAPLPFVFVHGFAGFADVGGAAYFYGVEEHLEALGYDVDAPALPPVNGSDARALVLADAIDAALLRTGAPRVHVVAHSQGGLDVRAVLPTHAAMIASVTTISTPHAGTRLAELALLAPAGTLNPAGRFLAWAIGLGGAPPDDDGDGDDDVDGGTAAWSAELAAAFASLTPDGTAALPAFPAAVPVFSWAGVSNGKDPADVDACVGACTGVAESPACDGLGAGTDAIDPLLAASATILLVDGANDGMVTVDSARAGTFMGCVPADHADEIGGFADEPPIASGFDHLAFYAAIAANARAVE